MKRTGDLFDGMTAFAHLAAAFKKARKGCGATAETCRFFFHLEKELLALQEALREERYRPAAYRFFKIHDPKTRTIAEAPFRDRVVHHAVVGAIEPVFERRFIFDSYATRTGKGTHEALRRARRFMKGRKWYLKTDIEKYFDSVDHDILMALLKRVLKDRRLLALVEKIVRNAPESGKGFPIGNLTSQFLANVYLDPFDHWIKDEIGIRAYVRYMDDMVLFSRDKAKLLRMIPVIQEFLYTRLKLTLKPKATMVNQAAHGLSFLGMRVFPNYIRVRTENRKRSLKRLDRRVAQWRAGDIADETLGQCAVSVAAHLRHFCPNAPIPLGTEAD